MIFGSLPAPTLSRRCAAAKQNGLPCDRMVLAGEVVCHIHAATTQNPDLPRASLVPKSEDCLQPTGAPKFRKGPTTS